MTATVDTDTAAELAVQLSRAEQRITRLQEDADRGGMFQHLSQEWHARYLKTLQALAKARTDRHGLVLRLDAAERHEAAVHAELLRRQRLEQEIETAGVLG